MCIAPAARECVLTSVSPGLHLVEWTRLIVDLSQIVAARKAQQSGPEVELSCKSASLKPQCCMESATYLLLPLQDGAKGQREIPHVHQANKWLATNHVLMKSWTNTIKKWSAESQIFCSLLQTTQQALDKYLLIANERSNRKTFQTVVGAVI